PARMRVGRRSDGALAVLITHTDPESAGGIEVEEVRAIAAKGDFRIDFKEPTAEVRNRAFGSWVYLLAFAELGYRFAYSEMCGPLRRAITGDREVPLHLRPDGGEPEGELLVVTRAIVASEFEWAFFGWSTWGGLLLWPTPHPDGVEALRKL